MVSLDAGFTVMSTVQEKSYYKRHPEFETIMRMPMLSIRIILSWCDPSSLIEYMKMENISQMMTLLEILKGLAVWCRHRGHTIPEIGTFRPEHINDWISWGKQSGYICEDSSV